MTYACSCGCSVPPAGSVICYSRSRARHGTATYPILLEAVLRAEEAVLDAELQAGRALQRAGLILTVGAKALFFRGRLGSHG